MSTKKAQIPVVFTVIFAIIVAALLLIWGVSSIAKLIGLSNEVDYQITIQNLNDAVQKRFNYETGSSIVKSFKTSSKITDFCFANKDLQLNTADTRLASLMEISDDNLFILPLDAEDKTSFKINNLKGKSNPECIKVKNNVLEVRLTTFDKYVEASAK